VLNGKFLLAFAYYVFWTLFSKRFVVDPINDHDNADAMDVIIIISKNHTHATRTRHTRAGNLLLLLVLCIHSLTSSLSLSLSLSLSPFACSKSDEDLNFFKVRKYRTCCFCAL